MIYLLVGENSFLRRQKIDQLIDGREAIRRDGSSLEAADLATVFAGNSLFGGDDTVILEDIAANKPVWDALEPWFARIDADMTVVIAETKPDKRTKTYKSAAKVAEVVVCDNWSPQQASQAVSWLTGYAKSKNIQLGPDIAAQLVERAIHPSDNDDKPVIDQALLARVCEQLQLINGVVQPGDIETVLPPPVYENVFVLLERAINGEGVLVKEMIERLKVSQDGHQLLGLLASQVTNIAALVLADVPSDQVASDIGAHPYALKQLSATARRVTKSDLERIVAALTRADEHLKHGHGDPWTLIETALMHIALKK